MTVARDVDVDVELLQLLEKVENNTALIADRLPARDTDWPNTEEAPGKTGEDRILLRLRNLQKEMHILQILQGLESSNNHVREWATKQIAAGACPSIFTKATQPQAPSQPNPEQRLSLPQLRSGVSSLLKILSLIEQQEESQSTGLSAQDAGQQ